MKTPFKKPLMLLAFSFAISVSSITAQAQSTSTDDALFQGLGAKAGIDKIIEDFIPIILADKRINRFFAVMDKKEFAGSLADQICELAGGPCKYKGSNMNDVHQGMNISNAHFNALAEDLQIAMEKNNISSSVSNKLIAILAPMQRPIVTK
jgi:hemoglobin